MKLHDNWRQLLRNAWSIRFMALAGLFSFLGDTVLPSYADLMEQKNRQAVAALAISAAALVGIASHEAFRGSTYKDSGGIPTLGYGETKGVVAGQTTTPERALQRLLESADEHAKDMNKCITVPLYQYEFDAYLSFTYNIGATAFCHSTLVKKLNAQDYTGACKELLKWDKVGNKQLVGLTKRRQAEYFTCIGQ